MDLVPYTSETVIDKIAVPVLVTPTVHFDGRRGEHGT
jgi:hypothetical protein